METAPDNSFFLQSPDRGLGEDTVELVQRRGRCALFHLPSWGLYARLLSPGALCHRGSFCMGLRKTAALPRCALRTLQSSCSKVYFQQRYTKTGVEGPENKRSSTKKGTVASEKDLFSDRACNAAIVNHQTEKCDPHAAPSAPPLCERAGYTQEFGVFVWTFRQFRECLGDVFLV
ncbi:hypothetical protein J6590_039043 [Homalodisca vitripennis]|nr:hypothetical protein J6590_039043 [Homalodisca vitripennis]